MKIVKIERPDYFKVTFRSNWIERLFRYKKTFTKNYFKVTGSYIFGGGGIYIDEDGRELGNGNWIGKELDQWLSIQMLEKRYKEQLKTKFEKDDE